ncbi:DNA-methyltransferase Dcm [Nitzschia inconspicua]|uniref:DNA-methyltransferase Dcm n=1 Tax=Nitzschia inconspicua TaxID=303405 RepID=A0A9K3Q6C3_9STRA|nr:DNA-methyltransferase Dcm [Nitzschia inconspicua]
MKQNLQLGSEKYGAKEKDEASTIHPFPELSMLEFFSGIGGMRIAVESALKWQHRHTDSVTTILQLSTCRAYDISLHANYCYEHNFLNQRSHQQQPASNKSEVSTKLVEHLKPEDVDGKANLWTMSPPCQPFTTNGKNKRCLDKEDKRCDGLKSLIRLLHNIQHKPQWILLENVQGFANSNMGQDWYDCLQQNGYTYKSYLLSPVQFGIPNHRLRFYVLAERSNRFEAESCGVCKEIPSFVTASPTTHSVGEYLEQNMEDVSRFLVPDSVLSKEFAKNLGIVSPADTATHCFTAGYGRIYHRSTGSLLLLGDSKDNSTIFVPAVAEVPIDRSKMSEYSGKLRRFTPRELLSLFGFPQQFEIPGEISLEHHYKLIGNSINVAVVTMLLVELLLLGKAKDHETTAALEKSTRTSGQICPHAGKLTIGGTKGHIEEEIDGILLKLYDQFRWKSIPNCTGRYTCRDHQLVSRLSPVELLERTQALPPSESSWVVHAFDLPGRPDRVLVTPTDADKSVGLITFVKIQEDGDMTYVHTLNTVSGFQRKLEAIGIQGLVENII